MNRAEYYFTEGGPMQDPPHVSACREHARLKAWQTSIVLKTFVVDVVYILGDVYLAPICSKAVFDSH